MSVPKSGMGCTNTCIRREYPIHKPVTDLEDIGEVSEIENIMEFNSCGQKVLNHFLVKPYCCLDYRSPTF